LLFTQHYADFVTALVPNHGKQLLNDARLVIPFYDEYNDLIAVSGRALETSDKLCVMLQYEQLIQTVSLCLV